MGLQVLLTTGKGDVYDVSQAICDQIKITDNMNQASSCTLSILPNDTVKPAEDCQLSIKYDDTIYFVGHVFKASITGDGADKITAYDQLRYLKTDDTYVFSGCTASQAIWQICGNYGLRRGGWEETGYNLGNKQFDGKDVLDICVDLLNLTLIGTTRIYYIKDIAGSVILRSINNSIGDLLVSPSNTMTKYTYERSIDESYNQIKLVRDNKDTGKRELYITKDSNNIAAWGGILQYYEKLDDNINREQAIAKADSLLLLKNRVQQKLSADVLGDKSVRAGTMVYVDLPCAAVKKYLLCTTAKHTFTNDSHNVTADFKLV